MRVFTASGSVYEFDFDASTVTRYPGENANKLRQDSETVPLLDLPDGMPRVGYGMRLVIDVRGDGVRTIRWTTAVTRIESTPPVVEETEDEP